MVGLRVVVVVDLCHCICLYLYLSLSCSAQSILITLFLTLLFVNLTAHVAFFWVPLFDFFTLSNRWPCLATTWVALCRFVPLCVLDVDGSTCLWLDGLMARCAVLIYSISYMIPPPIKSPNSPRSRRFRLRSCSSCRRGAAPQLILSSKIPIPHRVANPPTRDRTVLSRQRCQR